jgi:hypothetical protein
MDARLALFWNTVRGQLRDMVARQGDVLNQKRADPKAKQSEINAEESLYTTLDTRAEELIRLIDGL